MPFLSRANDEFQFHSVDLSHIGVRLCASLLAVAGCLADARHQSLMAIMSQSLCMLLWCDGIICLCAMRYYALSEPNNCCDQKPFINHLMNGMLEYETKQIIWIESYDVIFFFHFV